MFDLATGILDYIMDSFFFLAGGGGVGGGGGEACDSCQCSHMSNTPMHDVHMLKVLVWTQ